MPSSHSSASGGARPSRAGRTSAAGSQRATGAAAMPASAFNCAWPAGVGVAPARHQCPSRLKKSSRAMPGSCTPMRVIDAGAIGSRCSAARVCCWRCHAHSAASSSSAVTASSARR
ncbi:hypothetical protein [Metallibacterium sp.]|uniref:hypothetical protein n=1 Tax=Metallibacterium sp. TaxID=2940281 RepID=UPI00260F5423|nr:hypothetical protein [Metallibacterium sp.]